MNLELQRIRDKLFCLSWITSYYYKDWVYCKRKICYATKSEALKALEHLKPDRPIAPYPCKQCNGWHIGSGVHALKAGCTVYFEGVPYLYHSHHKDGRDIKKIREGLKNRNYLVRLVRFYKGTLKGIWVVFKLKATMDPRYKLKQENAKKRYLERCEKYGLKPYV